jgi:hypothetical protein
MVHVINPVAIPMCFVVLQEEVSAKLLEFLESPCITRDVVLTDDKKGKKRGRRSKGNGQATAEGASDGKVTSLGAKWLENVVLFSTYGFAKKKKPYIMSRLLVSAEVWCCASLSCLVC